MVKLCFEDFGKLSLSFGDYVDGDSRVIKSRECKVIKNNKPVLHTKQFYDSANPENNRKMIIKEDGGDE